MKIAGQIMIVAGAALAISDYIVTNGSNPPGQVGSALANVDDLNGMLSGVAPYVGVGTGLIVIGLAMIFL
jgi:hypothetical protein